MASRGLRCLDFSSCAEEWGWGWGDLRCSQSNGGAEWMPPVTVLNSKLQPTKRASRLACLQTHCVRWHFLSFSSLPLGGDGHLLWALGWGSPLYAMERQRQRPRNKEASTNDFVYWCLTEILYGSLRAPLKTLPPATQGLPPRERSLGSKDTLPYLPSISSTQRLAEKILA